MGPLKSWFFQMWGVTTLFLHPVFSVFQSIVNSSSSHVQATITPVLRGYIVLGYQPGKILRGPISSLLLFKENLTNLEEIMTWNITYNQDTGEYEIKCE